MRLLLFVLILSLPATVLTAQSRQKIAYDRDINADWKPGVVSITEITGAPGLGMTEDELSKYYYGITTIIGYQFTRNIRTGAGAGLHLHNGGMLIPLFLDIRYGFNGQKWVPYLDGGGGIMIDPEGLNETRVFINPAAGIKMVSGYRKAISLSAGVMVTTGGANARKSFLNFRLGLEFKGR